MELEDEMRLLGRNLCVPAHVDDDRILRACGSLIGNNAVKRIELCGSKKVIHLDPDCIERLAEDEDEMAEILDMYHELEAEGTLLFCFHARTESWTYGDQHPATRADTPVYFEVCFD
jgi:hypothetical protein